MGIEEIPTYILFCDNKKCKHGILENIPKRIQPDVVFYDEIYKWALNRGWIFNDSTGKTYCCLECQKEATDVDKS